MYSTHFMSPQPQIFNNPVTPEIGLPWLLSSKESTCNAGDAGDVSLIPGLGRSPGGGHGNPLQYFYLKKIP